MSAIKPGDASSGILRQDASRAGRKRILIISDSLGTPIHPRGIFYYTTNLIRALKACGHEVALLVETTGVHATFARRTSQLDSIYQYLAHNDFIDQYPVGPASWVPLLRRFHVPTRAFPLFSLRGIALSLRVSKAIKPTKVANRGAREVPKGLEHLGDITEFLTCRGIYTLSRATSVVGLQAPTIDVCGYDVILVDTPSYLRLEASAAASIVAVVHDLIPLTYDRIAPMGRRSFRRKMAATLATATDLVCVSQTTQLHLTNAFPNGVRGKTVTILHPSASDCSAPTQQSELAETIAAGASGYFVTILSDEPRKNLIELVRALALLPPDFRLKVIGHFTAARQAEFTAVDRRVEFLGYTSDALKKETLAGSLGLIMPSLLEGFGIPLIEAAFHGKPVFCSDTPVFHEVLGENAFYFEPHSPASIAQAILAYLEEPAKYRTRIAAAQVECLRRFSLQALIHAVEAYFSRLGADERTGTGG